MAKAYWRNGDMTGADVALGCALDARGDLAIDLIERWGMMTLARADDDGQGRAAYDLLPVEEVVRRAVTMAEATFVALEAKGWIKPSSRTMEEAHARMGELRQIASDAEYAERRKKSERALKD